MGDKSLNRPSPAPAILTSSDRFAATPFLEEEEETIPTASITTLLFLDRREVRRTKLGAELVTASHRRIYV